MCLTLTLKKRDKIFVEGFPSRESDDHKAEEKPETLNMLGVGVVGQLPHQHHIDLVPELVALEAELHHALDG